MDSEEICPLTPALLELLQASVDHEMTAAAPLARALHKSPATIRSDFQRALALLDVHERSAAVMRALDRGWVRRRPSSGAPAPKQ